MPVKVSSPNNPFLKEFNKLQRSRHYRSKMQQIALEGPNLVREAIKAGLNPSVIFYTGDYFENEGNKWLSELAPSVKQLELPWPLFKKIANTENPRAVAAIMSFGPKKNLKVCAGSMQLVLFLDKIQDPGNMGTIIRTAAAAEVDAIYYTSGSVDPYSPKVLRSTAGSIFSISIELCLEPLELFNNFKQENMQLVAADPNSDQAYWSANFRHPTVLIIGNETAGISPEIMAKADFRLAIPLAENINSLNASIAAAVILYEIIRQRNT